MALRKISERLVEVMEDAWPWLELVIVSCIALLVIGLYLWKYL